MGERYAEDGLGLVEVDAIGAEVVLHAAIGFSQASVGLDGFGDLAGALLRAEAEGDVGGVHEGGGEVTLADGSVDAFSGALADAGDPVGVVARSATGEVDLVDRLTIGLGLLALGVIGLRGVVVGHHDGAVLALDDDADVRSLLELTKLVHRSIHLAVSGQAVDFGDEGGGGVVVNRDEGVRGLGAVDVAEAATNRDNFGGNFMRAEEPASDVDFVDGLVAKVAAAVVPEPVPIVVDGARAGGFGVLVGLVAADGLLDVGWAVPEVVVDGRSNFVLLGRADGLAALVADRASDLHLAVLASVDVLDGGDDAGARAALRAGLDDKLAKVLRGSDELLTFEDVMRKRLFDVEVLAGLEGPDALDGVLVVRRGDRDGVNILVFEHLADVGVTLGTRDGL